MAKRMIEVAGNIALVFWAAAACTGLFTYFLLATLHFFVPGYKG